MNRRGFLASLLTAVAVVAIEVKLASPKPSAPNSNSYLRWDEANSRYDYGIDPNDPLDVVIYDNVEQRFVEPKELMRIWHNVNQDINVYGDKFDLAYEATAIIAMSQGHLLWKANKQRLVSICDDEPTPIDGLIQRRSSQHEEGLPYILTGAIAT